MRSTKKPKTFTPPPQEAPTVLRSTDDLARHLGLSRWTVSRVINGHAGVHPETARRVREAMEAHRFAPNPLARGLRRGRTSIIGICLPNIELFYLGRKLEILRQFFEERGFQIIIGMRGGTPAEEAHTLGHFRELRVAGLVVLASRLLPGSRSLEQLAQAGIPVVMADPLNPDFPDAITVDRAQGMREALAHLLAIGHRRIATLGLNGDGAYTGIRRKALDTMAQEHGLRLRHLSITSEESFYTSGQMAGEQLAALLLRPRTQRPTALLTINDRAAIGIHAALRPHGVRIPEDLSLIGYDNMEVSAFLSPGLTSIDADPERLIEAATNALLAKLEGKPPAPQVPVPTRLVLRGSTAAPSTGAGSRASGRVKAPSHRCR